MKECHLDKEPISSVSSAFCSFTFSEPVDMFNQRKLKSQKDDPDTILEQKVQDNRLDSLPLYQIYKVL